MRVIFAAWLIPAGLLASVGISDLTGYLIADTAQRSYLLNLAQAAAILLSIVTLLGGAIWAVRSWDLFPHLSSVQSDGWRWGYGWHLTAIAVAIPLAAFAPSVDGFTLFLWWLAAVVACFGGALLPRWLRQIGGFSSQAIVWLSAVIVYQITVGWLHLLSWTTVGSGLLVIEGASLAAFSLMTAWAVPEFGRRNLRVADSADESDLEEVGNAPLSLQEPALGH